MDQLTSFHFYPRRVLYVGVACLVFVILSVPFLFFFNDPFPCIQERKEELQLEIPLVISLGAERKTLVFPTFSLQEEMLFSFTPPRPGSGCREKELFVRLKKSKEVRKVFMPCRLGLDLRNDALHFSSGDSLFFVELSPSEEKVLGKWFVESEEKKILESGSFLLEVKEAPLQYAQELAEGSAFRVLAEAKWLGKDLLLGNVERIELSPNEFVEVKEGEWLVWKDGKWGDGREKDSPVVRLISSSEKGLLFEGWGAEEYVRFLVAAHSSAFKVRGEDLFSSLRIRSEKQISCILEKQCLVLKVGDWVLKTGGRWKILRRKEERNAFLHGKLLGELFIFEQIFQKQGQKMIRGRLLNVSRTQEIPIDLSAQSSRGTSRRSKR